MTAVTNSTYHQAVSQYATPGAIQGVTSPAGKDLDVVGFYVGRATPFVLSSAAGPDAARYDFDDAGAWRSPFSVPGEPLQLVTSFSSTAGGLAVVRRNDAGYLYTLSYANTYSQPYGGPFQGARALDMDPATFVIYLAGAGPQLLNSAEGVSLTDAGPTSNAESIVSLSARYRNLAYLYLAHDGSLGVAREWADGGIETASIPGAPAPLLGDGDAGIAQAGRQIAITSAGSVFFITDDGGWFWPAP